jgi:phage shock protein PspC (stress-responsive transcriptional regulator)
MLEIMNTERISSTVEDTVRDFWASRPRRPRRGRMVAGVAAGIGRRYGIDPVIVRVVLVVSAVYGGAGLLFYLLGWLLLPGESDEVSAAEALIHRGRSSTSALLTVLLCLALIPASSFVLGGPISTVVGAIMVLAAMYLLHRARSGYRPEVSPVEMELGRTLWGADPPAGAAPTAGNPPGDPNRSAVPPSPGVGQGRQGDAEDSPPAWDPLGAAPFAWDLPNPSPPAAEPMQRQRRPRVGWATVGAALVVTAGLAVVSPHVGWLDLRHDVGIVLAVLGAGMVAGSFVRGGRGLIGPALILALIGLVLPIAGLDRWAGMGNARYEPSVINDVQPTYQHSAGNMIVDLSQLAGSGTVHTTITEGAGNLSVRVPADATVRASCHTNVGTVDCLGAHDNGPNADRQASQNGTDGLTIIVTATNGAGYLEVTRG